MSKSKDEKVDGARIAAQILNNMPSPERARLVEAMKQADPSVIKKVSENLFSFEDIVELTARGVQLLIKEIDHRDLVISLKTASSKVKAVLYENMSERKRLSVDEDFNVLPKMPISEVEDAQFRILKRLDELRTAGKIR